MSGEYLDRSEKIKFLNVSQDQIEFFSIFLILLVICLFTSIDIISDLSEGAAMAHLAGEFVVAGLSFVGVVIFWWRAVNLRRQLLSQKKKTLAAETGHAQAAQEALKWRHEASNLIKGLSDAIDVQLSKWTLSNAEKEVALLLLKGLSLKEIATVRNVSEKTARAQSFSVYAKSGLSGRAELSAFFLEDLMLPRV